MRITRGVSIITIFIWGTLSLLSDTQAHAGPTFGDEAHARALANMNIYSSSVQPALPVENSGGNIIVYINWDGFAKYYLDLAETQGKVPTLSRIKNEGVFFANAYSGIPSITNPMQAAMASGTTPRFTDNHYRYFDKEL